MLCKCAKGGKIMVTTKQKKRISEMLKKRKELELLDLLIAFWESANDELELEYSKIVKIFCNDGQWGYFADKETENSGFLTTEVMEEIEKFSQEDCFSLKGGECELQQLGFSMTITETKFEMSIR